MDATLAPPRIRLDHLGNHWDSLHFQGPALMRNSARQRHPGCQPGNSMVYWKSWKTIGCSDISRTRKAWNRINNFSEYTTVGLFSVRGPHIAYEKPSEPLENIAFPSILAGTRSTTRNFGIAQKRLATETAAQDLLYIGPQS